MDLYDLIIGNREIFILIYTMLIGLICFIIVLRTDRLFRLSFHQGIRYFRNAFFFYGLAFISKYLLGTTPINRNLMKGIFEFFLIIAGFSLLYSLTWKKIEYLKTGSNSSLFNLRVSLFYLMAFILVGLDYLWQTYSFMFASQIVLFVYASIISGINYRKSKKKNNFMKVYFVVILLNLLAWILNFVVASLFNWNQIGVINIYILNLIIFALFLYGVTNVTKK